MDGKNPQRKITLHVPVALLDKAQQETGSGITETVRQGLRLVAAGDTFRRLRQLRGQVEVDLALDEMREDRR